MTNCVKSAGRPGKIDDENFTSAVLCFKDRIIVVDEKIVSKKNQVWADIENFLKSKVSSGSLYTYVCSGRAGIKKKLGLSCPQNLSHVVECESEQDYDSSTSDAFLNSSSKGLKHFLLFFKR